MTVCTSCGLAVHDLPYEDFADDEPLAIDLAIDVFFEHDDGGDLYCNGCVSAGQGVFL